MWHPVFGSDGRALVGNSQNARRSWSMHSVVLVRETIRPLPWWSEPGNANQLSWCRRDEWRKGENRDREIELFFMVCLWKSDVNDEDRAESKLPSRTATGTPRTQICIEAVPIKGATANSIRGWGCGFADPIGSIADSSNQWLKMIG